jgi:hypothetical protein
MAAAWDALANATYFVDHNGRLGAAYGNGTSATVAMTAPPLMAAGRAGASLSLLGAVAALAVEPLSGAVAVVDASSSLRTFSPTGTMLAGLSGGLGNVHLFGSQLGSAFGTPVNVTYLNSVAAVAAGRDGSLFVGTNGDLWNFTFVLRVSSAGVVTRAVGSGVGGSGTAFWPCAGDTSVGAPGASVGFASISGLAYFAPTDTLYVAEGKGHVIRRVTNATNAAAAWVTVFAGACGNNSFTVAGDGDGGPATAPNARLSFPAGLALDATGNVYVVDSGHGRVRVINVSTGAIAAFAGTGAVGYTGNGGAALAATMNLASNSGLAADSCGNIFVADTNNNALRIVNASSGVISAVAGLGLP